MKKKTLELFKQYLLANGCEIFTPTNEYELVRFAIPGRNTSVIYQKGSGDLGGMINDGEAVFEAFSHKLKFPSFEHKTKPMKKSNKRIRYLIERDGFECFYCQKVLLESEMTIEHLIPRCAGGLHHGANFAISCQPCNLHAGHLSVMEKIKIRDAALKNKLLPESMREIVKNIIDNSKLTLEELEKEFIRTEVHGQPATLRLWSKNNE